MLIIEIVLIDRWLKLLSGSILERMKERCQNTLKWVSNFEKHSSVLAEQVIWWIEWKWIVFGCWKCMNWNINVKDIKRSFISLKAIKQAIIGQLNFYLNNSLWKTEKEKTENVFEKKN